MDAAFWQEMRGLQRQLLSGRMAFLPDGVVEITDEEVAQRGYDASLLAKHGEYDFVWCVWRIPQSCIVNGVIA